VLAMEFSLSPADHTRAASTPSASPSSYPHFPTRLVSAAAVTALIRLVAGGCPAIPGRAQFPLTGRPPSTSGWTKWEQCFARPPSRPIMTGRAVKDCRLREEEGEEVHPHFLHSATPPPRTLRRDVSIPLMFGMSACSRTREAKRRTQRSSPTLRRRGMPCAAANHNPSVERAAFSS
jgi:hypothetical protein